LTRSQKSAEELTVSFGVLPLVMKFPDGAFTNTDKIFAKLIDKNILEKDDTVLIIHGQHWQKTGLTNAMQISRV
jgi:pyruvate kinase